MTASSAIDAGVAAAFAKAEAREPLLRAAVGFVPEDSRQVFRAWTALLAELRECAFELSDPRVTALKAGWWAEELDGAARGAARHPLTRVLVRAGGPWSGIAAPLQALATDADPEADLAATLAALRPLAEPLVAMERHLFGGDGAAEAQGRALALHWLRERLRHGLDAVDRARVPLALYARHGLRREQLPTPAAAALRRDWASQLRDALPASPSGRWPYPRLLTLDADRRALAALAAGGRPAERGTGVPALWRAWRLARNAALQVRGPTAAPT